MNEINPKYENTPTINQSKSSILRESVINYNIATTLIRHIIDISLLWLLRLSCSKRFI
jgi:hypothetical protein